MAESADGMQGDAIVSDRRGRRYVVVHPGYAMTPGQYRRALATRISVCVLSVAALVFNLIGEAVPYCSLRSRLQSDVDYYSLWFEWSGSMTSPKFRSTNLDITGIMAVVSLGFTLIAVVLAGVLAGTLPRAEKERLEDKANSEMAMAKYGHLRQEYGDTDDSDTFPYTNLRIANQGQVGEVPYEAHELARRNYDRNLCAAALSMLIVADIFAVTAVSLMGAEYTNLMEYSWYTYYDLLKIEAGIPLMAVATGLLFIAFIVVAIPQITGVPLCGSLLPPRCVLMVIDDGTTMEVQEQLQRYLQTEDAALAYTAQGVRVALPGLPMSELIPDYQEMRAVHTLPPPPGNND